MSVELFSTKVVVVVSVATIAGIAYYYYTRASAEKEPVTPKKKTPPSLDIIPQTTANEAKKENSNVSSSPSHTGTGTQLSPSSVEQARNDISEVEQSSSVASPMSQRSSLSQNPDIKDPVVRLRAAFGREVGDSPIILAESTGALSRPSGAAPGKAIVTGEHICFCSESARVDRIIAFEDIVSFKPFGEAVFALEEDVELTVTCINGQKFVFLGISRDAVSTAATVWSSVSPHYVPVDDTSEAAVPLLSPISLVTPGPGDNRDRWPKTMTVFSAVSANEPELEHGNQVILPSAVLSEIDGELGTPTPRATPYCFSIRGETSVYTTHCGVRSFTAPENNIFMPYWVMHNLGIDEGSKVLVNHVNVPHANSALVQLQPHRAAWVDIPWEVRNAVLHDQLGKLQVLTRGDVVPVKYQGQVYAMTVTKCEPSPVSLIDVDLATDVIEPLEEIQLPTRMELGASMDGKLEAGESFTFDVFSEDGRGVQIALAPSEGFVDLYVSSEHNQPRRNLYTWSDTRPGIRSLIVSPSSSPPFRPGRVYITVHNVLDELAEFSLKVTVNDNALDDEHDRPSGDDTEQCDHCQQRILSSALSMHTLQCARRSWTCDQCGACMLTRAREHHVAVEHEPLWCECGAVFTQRDLNEHQSMECPLRIMPCLYCPLSFTALDLPAHEETCGACTTACLRCFRRLPKNKLRKHLENETNTQGFPLPVEDVWREAIEFQPPTVAPVVYSVLGEKGYFEDYPTMTSLRIEAANVAGPDTVSLPQKNKIINVRFMTERDTQTGREVPVRRIVSDFADLGGAHLSLVDRRAFEFRQMWENDRRAQDEAWASPSPAPFDDSFESGDESSDSEED